MNMSLEELTTLYERIIGSGGAICPRCHGNMTEGMGRGTWICWTCGQQFHEDEHERPVPVPEAA